MKSSSTRWILLGASCLFGVLVASDASADGASNANGASPARAQKPWCAPEVTELSDHVCYLDGGASDTGKHTLVIYLHGMLADTPGFAWLQHRAMAMHAQRQHFTVLMPTSPKADGAYVWPTSQAAMKEQEPAIIAGIVRARHDLEARLGHGFDETYVIGFSSGAYYGSSAAVRGVIPDIDGTMVLAGGSSWVPAGEAAKGEKRAPIFVGVSASDPQTRDHSRGFAGTLAALHWPYRVEERPVGHMVDWGFMARGMSWLRAQRRERVTSRD